MTGSYLHMQWPLISQSHGSVSQSKILIKSLKDFCFLFQVDIAKSRPKDKPGESMKI
jgi:hypothetical protein